MRRPNRGNAIMSGAKPLDAIDKRILAIVQVNASLAIGEHSAETQATFAREVSAMREVLDFHRMAGDVDYMLRVVVPDTAAFDAFYKRLVQLAPLKSVKSRFALEGLKSETALPI